MMTILSKKYRLKDGRVYWHQLYFAIAPRWMKAYSPPGGDYNYAFYLYQPHKYLIALYDHVRYFIQRGYRGYSDRDVWSIDYYLNSWMPQALEQLKRTTHGHPIGMTKKQWEHRLDQMINAFKIAKNIDYYTYVKPEECRAARRQFRKNFDVFKNYYFSLWA